MVVGGTSSSVCFWFSIKSDSLVRRHTHTHTTLNPKPHTHFFNPKPWTSRPWARSGIWRESARNLQNWPRETVRILIHANSRHELSGLESHSVGILACAHARIHRTHSPANTLKRPWKETPKQEYIGDISRNDPKTEVLFWCEIIRQPCETVWKITNRGPPTLWILSQTH
jgi:hypothetical protein